MPGLAGLLLGSVVSGTPAGVILTGDDGRTIREDGSEGVGAGGGVIGF